MSFDINWSLLDKDIANQLKNWINERFSEIERPSFLGPLHVTEFDFGDVPPTIEIKNISDPYLEFYLPDDYENFPYIGGQDTSRYYGPPALHTPHTPNQTPQTPTREPHLRNPSSQSQNQVPGSAANSKNGQQSPSDAGSAGSIVPPSYGNVGNGGNGGNGHHGGGGYYGGEFGGESLDRHEFLMKHINAMRRDSDVQVELLVDYRGNLRFSVSTELIVNQPTPGFITLPLTLTLTGFSFTALAIICYLGDKISFCLREIEESDSLLKDISIESEVGDKNRQVLKNVSKIEKFVVEQVRNVVSDHLVYPSFHTISFVNDSSESEHDDDTFDQSC
ncbi:Mitochondrial distribution and morphology protein 12 [Blyttiomyces sp. JEL0837]|nr:Mitochondrial distribution and morphology protein 12 [Blyttiomyces sp. JEL0837]